MADNQVIAGKVLTWDELPKFIRDALKKIAKDEGFVSPTFTLSSGSNIGDGFVSIMLRVVIKGYKVSNSINTKGVKQELKVIAKIAPLSKARRETFGANILFEREVKMYNEYLPVLEKFQIEHGINRSEGLYSSPRCYFATFDREKDETVLILEDLGEEEFGMWNKFEPMDFFHASKVMQSLGRFHGLSMVLKKQKPEVFEQFKSYHDLFSPMLESNAMQEMFTAHFDNAIKNFPESETIPREKLQRYKENFVNDFRDMINPERAEPYTVINHGDCWINNFMFRKGTSFRPTTMAFIDYQIARYASPALDLVYFIFTSTDKKLRDQHFEDLLQIYHNAFGAILRRCGEDVEKLFPYEALQEHLVKFGRFGVAMAFMVLPVITMQAQDIPDFDKASEAMAKKEETNEESPELQEIMKQFEANANRTFGRIKDVIIDSIDHGYL